MHTLKVCECTHLRCVDAHSWTGKDVIIISEVRSLYVCIRYIGVCMQLRVCVCVCIHSQVCAFIHKCVHASVMCVHAFNKAYLVTFVVNYSSVVGDSGRA